jgi:alkanesulfonate monooxygenase SsuD/methylene tetrahydromethanopterin reductase-like flavin-dependent oxidoreductase (luciferase family)
MVTTLVRFNQVQPGLEPRAMADRYQASLDMAAYADTNGFALVTLEEHHGADDGWSPSPLVSAGLVFGRCPRIHVVIMALLLPLHDPVRLAEDIAVLDLASGGRLSIVGGLGYRPEEYELLGKSWADRGRLMDEAVDTLLKAWSGEPFEYRGSTVRVTPIPFTRPHPNLSIGGTSKPSARRAARFGLPLATAAYLPELESYYYEQCREAGTEGFCSMPPGKFSTTYVAEDPDRAWAEVGPYMLHEATVYANWQTPDIHSAVHSHALSTDELRAEGIYEILTPDECVTRAEEAGPAATFALHPLVGGMPIDKGWECLTLYVEKVLPRLQA